MTQRSLADEIGDAIAKAVAAAIGYIITGLIGLAAYLVIYLGREILGATINNITIRIYNLGGGRTQIISQIQVAGSINESSQNVTPDATIADHNTQGPESIELKSLGIREGTIEEKDEKTDVATTYHSSLTIPTSELLSATTAAMLGRSISSALLRNNPSSQQRVITADDEPDAAPLLQPGDPRRESKRGSLTDSKEQKEDDFEIVDEPLLHESKLPVANLSGTPHLLDDYKSPTLKL